ncbi:cupin domain-containing protein [Streptomyces sp. ODS05-4]|uniref:cupin domain-containing protein n=1 Tax=Streptomyces sp. ODS05-4 TaxID=2944939 RepID=UPI00210AB4B2|nr:cupin domain-containing protein [Streptomyces sp. ODS05-4]
MKKAVRVAVVAAVAAVSTLTGITMAGATAPGAGVSGKTVYQWTAGGKDHILRQITIPPGQSTGWHFHDGTLRGAVVKGTLSHFDSRCAPDGTYRAGQPLTEPAGAGNVHIGRNLGAGPVVMEILYVLPHGAPLSEDAPDPGCAFR